MAKTLTYHSRTTFWGGVRAILSFDIGFSPFASAQFHLLGFGFNVIHFRSGGRLTQFSIALSVPFYIAGFYYLPSRQDDAPTPPASPDEVQGGIDERGGRADYFAQRAGLVQDSNDSPAVR